MVRLPMVLAAVLVAAYLASAQSPIGICVGPAACPNATNGDLWSDTSAGTLKRFNGTTWDLVGGGQGESVPAGSILLIDSGACPSGYSEVSALNGKTILGTLDANANVGSTGGADAITPAGTNSGAAVADHSYTPAGAVSQPTFSGNAFTAVINHTHTVTVTDPGHTHTQASQTATTGSASSWEHGAIDTSSAAAETLPTGSSTTGVTASTANPAGGVASITPSGTVSQPTFSGNAAALTHSVTQPSFSGTQFDNRSAFIRLIACKKT